MAYASASAKTTVASILNFQDASPEVSVHDRMLGDDVVILLCEKLKSIENKSRLVLRGNCISGVGAEAIADLIATTTYLKTISLEWNQIDTRGIKSISNALLSNKHLIHLDLRNNAITDEGAMALSESLKENKTLKTLDLRWNQISDKGGLSFEKCFLDRYPSPLSLQINGNPISQSAMVTLEDWMHGGRQSSSQSILSSSSSSSSSFGLKISKENDDNENIENIDTQTSNVRSSLLQKELSLLRHQLLTQQSTSEDLRRQLDSSAMKVTEVEQQLRKEEFRTGLSHL